MTREAVRSVRVRQTGVTLVELLVAMTVGLLVTIVALSTLILSRSGYSAVDSSSQLVDRERFVVDSLSRVISQAGFQDYNSKSSALMTRAISKKLGGDPEPDLFGWNNAFYTELSDLQISSTTNIVDGNRPTKCGTITDTSCQNGSDILAVRFQGSGTVAVPDGTMLNCMGNAEPGIIAGSLDQRAANILYVARDSNTGEPSLYCSYYNFSTAPLAPPIGWVAGQPLIEGVESMQLLFGTDNVVPATAPTFVAADLDTITDRWLRADQLKVADNPVATRENWRRVRAVRVGLLLRGPVASAQERVSATFAPLGTVYSSSADNGSSLTTAADGRLRRVVNFTVHLRNNLTATQ